MAETEEDSQAVLKAERRAKGKLAIGFNRRFAPAYCHAKSLMINVPRPWFLTYRLMMPSPDKGPQTYYGEEPRILYEGCHILDLICWFMGERPCKVYMTGDRLRNNSCLMSFRDGSQVSFVCGSMGSLCLWKEYMEVFSNYHAITVSEFIDMRVRDFEGQFDRLFAPDCGMYEQEVMKSGFDYYETLVTEKFHQKYDEIARISEHAKFMLQEHVCRPLPLRSPLEIDIPFKDPAVYLRPDKGWKDSLEHFAKAFLDDAQPHNANGAAGSLATELALALLKSLELGTPLSF